MQPAALLGPRRWHCRRSTLRSTCRCTVARCARGTDFEGKLLLDVLKGCKRLWALGPHLYCTPARCRADLLLRKRNTAADSTTPHGVPSGPRAHDAETRVALRSPRHRTHRRGPETHARSRSRVGSAHTRPRQTPHDARASPYGSLITDATATETQSQAQRRHSSSRYYSSSCTTVNRLPYRLLDTIRAIEPRSSMAQC